MEHKIWYDDENQVLHQQVIGNFTTEDALKSERLSKEFLQDKQIRQLIVDLSAGGKMENRETRQIATRLFSDQKITDVAYIGATSATRMIAKVLMKLGNMKASIDFFKTEQEALTWLKNRRK
jgi:hypothetical protein